MEASPGTIATLTAVQFIFWSVVFEFSEALVTAAFGNTTLRRRYTGLKTSFGNAVWTEVSTTGAVALQHLCGAFAAVLGWTFGSPALMLWGLTSEAAFRLNDLLLAASGMRRHAAAVTLVRGLLISHDCLSLALTFAAAASFAGDHRVQLICVAWLGSGALLALAVPLQYACSLMTQAGCRANLVLQSVTLVGFLGGKFAIGIFPRPGAYAELVKALYAVNPASALFFAWGILMTSFVFSAMVAALMFQRIRKTKQAYNKIKHTRQWFEKNQSDKGEDDVQKQTWTTAKINDTLFGLPGDMMTASLKASGWYRAFLKSATKGK